MAGGPVIDRPAGGREVVLHRQFEVHVACSPVAVIEAVELPQRPAFPLHGQVVRYQFRARVLLQEEMPQLLEVHPQPVAVAPREMGQQRCRVAVELFQPQPAPGRQRGGAVVHTRAGQFAHVEQGRREAGPREVANFLGLVGINGGLCATLLGMVIIATPPGMDAV